VPLALWTRGTGSLGELTSPAVTITGARASSDQGDAIAADISHELARAGVTVVSGGALGIDAATHGGALAAGGRTIVVLPCGVDRTHPHQHAGLYTMVIERGGLLVSEYPAGTPTRVRRHARCRLLGALTSATVIVEAGRHGGVLAAARAASNLGRRVYGVPDAEDAPRSAGVNDLLRSGLATAISNVSDIDYQEKLR
jgi:DNA processing protein